MSTGTVNRLLRSLAAKYVVDNLSADYHPLFRKYQDILDAIDTIEYGEAPWQTFAFRFDDPVSPESLRLAPATLSRPLRAKYSALRFSEWTLLLNNRV